MEPKTRQRSSSTAAAAAANGGVILGKYKLGRLLGRGSFAKVYSALSIADGDKTPVAVKVIDKRQTIDAAMEPRVLREISAMRRLSHHPNILKIHEVLATKSKIYLVMDLARGGDLHSHLARRPGGRMTESAARRYFQQLVCALNFCHVNGVSHRDIKPQNLLLDEAGSVKVSDFGLSAFSDVGADPLRTACGTPAFTAPEVVCRGGYDGGKADAWSCGVMLFLFLFGFLPFDDSNLAAMYKKMLRREFQFPQNCPVSKQAKFLIYHLLDPNPASRLSIETLAHHSWLKKSASPLGPNQKFAPSERKIAAEQGMNAFDIISMSSGLDLSGLFESCDRRERVLERRFTAVAGREEVEERVVEVGGKLGFRVERAKGGSMGLAKGRARFVVDIVEVAAAVAVVAVTVALDGSVGVVVEECEWDNLRLGFEELGLFRPSDVS